MSKPEYKSKSHKDTKLKNKSNKSKRKTHDVSIDTEHISGPINDVNYYFTNDLMKNQLANISFNEFTGTPNVPRSLIDNEVQIEEIPYAMRIALNPSAGFTNDTGDTTMGNALNLASLGIYTKLSANNAKTTNYAPQDITTLMLALGSVISLTSHITRIFGVAYLYNQRNRSYPRNIMSVLGIDYDDLIANYANYRAQFNTLMVSASKIPFPSNVSYFKKCSELYSGIYLDMGGSDMAQSYVFVPHTEWLLDETYTEEGTALVPFILHERNEVTTMNILLYNLNLMIGALLNSTTLNSIYSDILRVAQKEGMTLYQFAAIPDNYVVLPQYVPEIRLWINNLTVIGSPLAEPSEGYTPSNYVLPDVDSNKIKYRPQFQFADSLIGALLTPYLNFDYGNPSVDDIVVATRLTSIPDLDIMDGKVRSKSVALPDHYVTYFTLYTPNDKDTTSSWGLLDTWNKAFNYLSCFDWSPMFHITGPTGYIGHFGDLNYYTTLDYKYASRLHDATYLGLFEIR